MTTTCTWMFTTRLWGTHMHISAASAVIGFILWRRLCTSAFPFCIRVLRVLLLSLLLTCIDGSLFLYLYFLVSSSFSFLFSVSTCFLSWMFFCYVSLFPLFLQFTFLYLMVLFLYSFLFVSGLVYDINSFSIQHSYAYFYYSESLFFYMLYIVDGVCRWCRKNLPDLAQAALVKAKERLPSSSNV